MIRNLRRERLKRGLTQLDLAKLANRTSTCISDIEKGKADPSYKLLVDLERLFYPLKHDYLLAESEKE